jgi:hypothetical protein
MSNESKRTPPVSGGIGLLLLVGAALAVAAGCGRSEAAQPRKVAAENTTQVGAGPKAETDNYIAEIKANGSYKAGAEGTVEVILVAKGSYHTNEQYPYKFRTADPAPDGVTFPKPVLQRADGSFDKAKGTFKVPFVAAKAGKVTISGTLSLSVCSDANCIMDKVPLEVAVDVK